MNDLAALPALCLAPASCRRRRRCNRCLPLIQLSLPNPPAVRASLKSVHLLLTLHRSSMPCQAAVAALLLPLLLVAQLAAAAAASARQLQARTIYPPDPVAAAGAAKKATGGKPSEA